MPAIVPKPKGFYCRRRRDGSMAYSLMHPTLNREIVVGGDAESAYRIWDRLRAETVSPPDPITLTWLLEEFLYRNRPADSRQRKCMVREIEHLSSFFYGIGNPSVTDLTALHCQIYRDGDMRGTVGIETRIRRLRQVWRWAQIQNLIDGDCPWVASGRKYAITVEVVDIVLRFLSPDVLQDIHKLLQSVKTGDKPSHDLAQKHLASCVSEAVRQAVACLKRDGRPDLVPTVTACSLKTIISWSELPAVDEAQRATLFLGHSRTTFVIDTRRNMKHTQDNTIQRSASDTD